MKSLFVTLVVATCALTHTSAQGTIVFNNGPLTRLTIPTGDGGVRSATHFNVAIYYATTPGEWQGPLLPIGRWVPTAPGLFTAPGGENYGIPGTVEGQTISMQIFLWESTYGEEPYQAWVNGSATGSTGVRQVTLGGTVNGPAVIWQSATGTNPNRFTPLTYMLGPYDAPPVVPEPSTLGFGALAGALLVFRLRKSIKSN